MAFIVPLDKFVWMNPALSDSEAVRCSFAISATLGNMPAGSKVIVELVFRSVDPTIFAIVHLILRNAGLAKCRFLVETVALSF